MARLIIIFTLICISNISFAQTRDARLNGLDSEINNLLQAYHAAGISVTLVENNKVLYAKGFGYRDLEHKLLVDANTAFPIGSITKSFTASLIGVLENRNVLSIKDKPSKFIPGLQFYTDKMDNQITIGDLLCHRSGIGNADGAYIFFPPKNRADFMPRLKFIAPNAPVCDGWAYSNMGYLIAGTIAENASNQGWENLLKSNIFNPLQMQSSGTDIAGMIKTNNYSIGYGLSNGKIKKVLFEQLKSESPAGGINSTGSDLANYMMAWLNNGIFKDKEVLPKKYVQEATSLKAIDNGAPPEESSPDVYMFGYGYGWKINSHKGHYKVHHGGNVSGFSSQLVLFPTDKIGIVVLVNQNNSILPYIVADIITNRLLKLNRTDWDKYPVKVADIYTTDSTVQSADTAPAPSHDLHKYCGKYTHPGYGTFEMSLETNELYINFPRDRFRLEHQYFDIFVMKPTKEISQYFNPEFLLNFALDNHGDISGVKINFQNEPVEFVKNP